ncbi:ribosomal RNA small subunit methyltransferase H [Clostridia bacterium]|nr:ribosomal RNA small subunit methyltransferase H [Clostridia bacterium]
MMNNHEEFKHVSVLLEESINALQVRDGGIYVDGTLGGAGHSGLLLQTADIQKLIGIDRDKKAIEVAGSRLARYGEKVSLVNDNFCNIAMILDDLGIGKIDGGLLDLGVSSYQFDEPERGFSYRFDAPLDMRMDNSQGRTAADVVNEYEEQRLAQILADYGEEKYARQIAKKIVAKRPINTTFELVDVIKSAVPPKVRYAEGKHPAKRCFQAIRIEVNDELAILDKTIEDFADRLNYGGRLAIITFHSLEDRIVKNAFKRLEGGKCTCPKDFPVCVCGKGESGYEIITKKPILPSGDELEENTRSASAKLRVLSRVRV